MKGNGQKVKKKLMVSVPYATLVVCLLVLYIGNVHRAERNLREVKQLKAAVQEAKWEYEDLEQSILTEGTQIQLLKELQGKGIPLEINRSVPSKITIDSKS